MNKYINKELNNKQSTFMIGAKNLSGPQSFHRTHRTDVPEREECIWCCKKTT